jgi:tRNA pseudouridine13 synthase
LEYTGLNQARRKLAERPHEFASESSTDGEMLLCFALPPGVFATTLLANSLQIVDDSLLR